MVERCEIIKAALKQYGRASSSVDVAALARQTPEFTGAELAALVPDAMYRAFGEDRDISTGDLIDAASATVPLARTAPEKIKALQDWAQGRARPASAPESMAEQRRTLDL
jgi:SpoVK/Ycf46/Vps4 family AAA+-type ATPase